MKEVEIPPRDVYCHYVSVASLEGSPQLLWWFNTKRRNVAFGLFYKPGTLLPSNTSTGAFLHTSTEADLPPMPATAVTTTSRPSMEPSGSDQKRPPSLHSLHPPRSPGFRSADPSDPSASSLYAADSAEEDSDGASFIGQAPPQTPGPHTSSSPSSSARKPPPATNIQSPPHPTPTTSSPHFQISPAKRVRTTPVGPLLQDPQLVEISPVAYYETSKATIKGRYTVQETGTYVFVFDNTFSRNTSKRMTFFVALHTPGSPSSSSSSQDPISSFPPLAPVAGVAPNTSSLSSSPAISGTRDLPPHTTSMASSIPSSSSHTAAASLHTDPPALSTHLASVQPAASSSSSSSSSFSSSSSAAATPASPPSSSSPLSDPALPKSTLDPQHNPLTLTFSGWVLKKKRKRMQGWARRYLQLEGGVLSYSKTIDGRPRGSIPVALATIAISPSRLLVNVDSGLHLYQLRMESQASFDQWVSILRESKSHAGLDLSSRLGPDSPARALTRRSRRPGTMALRMSKGASAPTPSSSSLSPSTTATGAHHASALQEHAEFRFAQAAQNTLAAYEEIRASINQEMRAMASALQDAQSLGISSHETSRSTTTTSIEDPNGKPSNHRVPGKGKASKPSDPSSLTQSPQDQELISRLKNSYEGIRRHLIRLSNVQDQELDQRDRVLEYIRAISCENQELRQQLGLSNAQSTPLDEETTASVNDQHGKSQEEEEEEEEGEEEYVNTRSLNARSMSIISNYSMDDTFFDASEEILVADDFSSSSEEEEEEEEEEVSSAAKQPPLSQPDEALISDEEVQLPKCTDDEETPTAASSSTASSASASPSVKDTLHSAKDITLRTALPAPVSGPEVSLLSIMRKNMGKDLSQVAMPVSLNEPLNLLQRQCEELEYSDLLDRAIQHPSPQGRLAYVAAFAVSGYASSQYRASRKPFNPLLGETYSWVDTKHGFRFISEKVSHHPPIMACHAESQKGWIFWQAASPKSKFWGKSMEMSTVGEVHIEFPALKEHYTFQKPTTWMRNLVGGTRYLEHCGDLIITSHSTGATATMTFREAKGGGFFSSSASAPNRNEIFGQIMGPGGREVVNVVRGRWNEYLALFSPSSPAASASASSSTAGPPSLDEVPALGGEVLWRAQDPPSNSARYYGFTAMAMSLNAPDSTGPPGSVAPTDTRFRPDQRAFEEGRVEDADALKAKLEGAQRERRKEMELQGVKWSPQWFTQRPVTHGTDPESWVYAGGYWEAKSTTSFPSNTELW